MLPYHFVFFYRDGLFYGKSTTLGNNNIEPNADLATVIQAALNLRGGNGIFYLKNVALPSGLTYRGTAVMWELYDGIEAKYTNGVPMDNTIYVRLTSTVNEFDEPVTLREVVIVAGGVETVLKADLVEG
jgi:hypothetical protein